MAEIIDFQEKRSERNKKEWDKILNDFEKYIEARSNDPAIQALVLRRKDLLIKEMSDRGYWEDKVNAYIDCSYEDLDGDIFLWVGTMLEDEGYSIIQIADSLEDAMRGVELDSGIHNKADFVKSFKDSVNEDEDYILMVQEFEKENHYWYTRFGMLSIEREE